MLFPAAPYQTMPPSSLPMVYPDPDDDEPDNDEEPEEEEEEERYNDPFDPYDDFDNFDPASADPENIIGNPDQDVLDLWESQGSTNRCAIYSQKFVIEEFTGREIDIQELVDVAIDNGWFSERGGTLLIDMAQLLDYEDLVLCLENCSKVIFSIDADEVWFGEDEDLYSPNDSVNHAIEVIGIDNSDPDNPMVIVNDSGHPDGQGALYPLDQFLDAWEDGNCQLIECIPA